MAAGEAEKGTVRICDLDPRQRLDTPWPVARQPQRATPTALGFYPEAQLHIVAVSRQVRMIRTQVTCSIVQPICKSCRSIGFRFDAWPSVGRMVCTVQVSGELLPGPCVFWRSAFSDLAIDTGGRTLF